VACPVDLRAAVVARVAAAYEAAGRRLVTIDGVKAFSDDGWVLLRPSGTEPLLRLFAESKDPATARRLADEGRASVDAAVRTLTASA
ncbi:protein containing Alpha-D-phosphohexomutase, partial [mine drainage metagenome]